MKNRWFPALLLAPTLALPTSGYADVLLIEAVKKAAETPIVRPANGMTRRAVEKRFGQPERRHAPVGDPPITRWDYPQFSVYFEYDRVITSVLKR